LDANGDVVKEDLVLYAFIWIGILSAIGLILAGVLAFVFDAPAGVLITRFLNRNRKDAQVVNIEPE
jgi:Na+-transporting methylmalonyl-CoA/oxaloacetate decarboxylase beta subunit